MKKIPDLEPWSAPTLFFYDDLRMQKVENLQASIQNMNENIQSLGENIQKEIGAKIDKLETLADLASQLSLCSEVKALLKQLQLKLEKFPKKQKQMHKERHKVLKELIILISFCLLYTSDAADDTPCVDLGGRRLIKKKNKL
eukprot:TRINITY_DN12040_c0_g2_i1.p1 TRINITY_DN12040_c0_g2~~TRINITY_DN12040_c0_g2_i1.p1  ORF type:complete len:142 (-),score=34.36 TRINITY_DN12040_c0_g2_i1:63-488(-)